MNGRTVYQGHLFVGDQLLSECGIQHHPLTPMTDANLCRWMAHFKQQVPSLKLSPLALASGEQTLASIMDWFNAHQQDITQAQAFMIYATDTPEAIAQVQAQLGTQNASEQVEEMMAQFVTALWHAGVRKFVVAGGETSGAVVKALAPQALTVGNAIAPGVPLTETEVSLDGKTATTLLALKSGNFGDEAFFSKATKLMNSSSRTLA